MNDELKPCPFCGGPASRQVNVLDHGGTTYETGCDNVGCQVLPSAMQLGAAHADVAWNTRTDTIPSAAYVARLEAALRHVADGQPKDFTDNCLLARAALASRPASPDARVVTVEQLDSLATVLGAIDGEDPVDNEIRDILVKDIRAIIGGQP